MTAQPDPGAPATGWDEAQSQRWLSQLETREAPLVPVLHALFGAANLQPGERVLDLGCGAGPSTVEAARRVGSSGQVTGVDISPSMIEAARSRAGTATGEGVAPIDWLVADAEQHPFGPASFDAVISRFGVMFFPDPLRAFRNIASACRSGGRLVMAVWPERPRSEFFSRPLDVVVHAGNRLGVRLALPPPDRGPFSLGDPSRLEQLLAAAGWTQIEIRTDQRPLYFSGRDASAEQAVDAVLAFGPARMVLEDQPAELVTAVRGELLDALPAWRDGNGVGLPGGFLIVSARR